MARFTVQRPINASAQRTWDLVPDWQAHGRWIPATTMTVTVATGGVGEQFVGRSGVGRLAFDDPMIVTRWEPPTDTRAGTAGIAHTGSLVLGTAEVQVVPQPGGRCRLRWTEDIALLNRQLSRPLLPFVVLGGRFAFARTLAAVAKELEADDRA